MLGIMETEDVGIRRPFLFDRRRAGGSIIRGPGHRELGAAPRRTLESHIGREAAAAIHRRGMAFRASGLGGDRRHRVDRSQDSASRTGERGSLGLGLNPHQRVRVGSPEIVERRGRNAVSRKPLHIGQAVAERKSNEEGEIGIET